jgi:serine O-acetyltransferase
MNFKEYRYLVYSDLYRLTGEHRFGVLLRQVLRGEGFKFSFWMRTCRYLRQQPVGKFLLYPLAKMLFTHYTYKLGISIPYATRIDSGFYIGHFGGIVVNSRSVIGRNCNISPGVGIGRASRGRNKGTPTIGDNVYIGPGAKIVGAVTVGNNVAIGANCVVSSDIPDDSVVVGQGEIISQNGSAGYVNLTDYPGPDEI